jgi:hypothetical protein
MGLELKARAGGGTLTPPPGRASWPLEGATEDCMLSLALRRREDVPTAATASTEEPMTDRQRKRRSHEPETVAGNGLLDRRTLLGRGIIFAGAASAGVGTALTGAAAEPLAVDPWSLAPGAPIPAYGAPSKYEVKVVRTLTNPKNEPRTSGARTPHHLLDGTITPAQSGRAQSAP